VRGTTKHMDEANAQRRMPNFTVIQHQLSRIQHLMTVNR
jgi:hypothetical protein